MYFSVLAPIRAVAVSILWEGSQMQVLTLLRIFAALAGAWITLSGKKA